jgi:hypothetical protein
VRLHWHETIEILKGLLTRQLRRRTIGPGRGEGRALRFVPPELPRGPHRPPGPTGGSTNRPRALPGHRHRWLPMVQVRVNKLPFSLPLSFKFNKLVPSMGMVIMMINAGGACRRGTRIGKAVHSLRPRRCPSPQARRPTGCPPGPPTPASIFNYFKFPHWTRVW